MGEKRRLPAPVPAPSLPGRRRPQQLREGAGAHPSRPDTSRLSGTVTSAPSASALSSSDLREEGKRRGTRISGMLSGDPERDHVILEPTVRGLMSKTDTNKPLFFPPGEGVHTRVHTHTHTPTQYMLRPKRKGKRKSLACNSPASRAVPFSILRAGVGPSATVAAPRRNERISSEARPGAPSASHPAGGASQLLLPPRPRVPGGPEGSRAAAGRCPGRCREPGGRAHTEGGKLLRPGNPHRDLTLRSRRSRPRTRSSAREGGRRRPEVRASPRISPRGPLLIQINKSTGGWVGGWFSLSLPLSLLPTLSPSFSLSLSLPAPLSVGIDPNPSPLTRSSLHLSFIFYLCFQIGRRRRKGWAEDTDEDQCRETSSEAAFSPSSLSVIREGVNGGLGRLGTS